jgi:hypothetical protein
MLSFDSNRPTIDESETHARGLLTPSRNQRRRRSNYSVAYQKLGKPVVEVAEHFFGTQHTGGIN